MAMDSDLRSYKARPFVRWEAPLVMDVPRHGWFSRLVLVGAWIGLASALVLLFAR